MSQHLLAFVLVGALVAVSCLSERAALELERGPSTHPTAQEYDPLETTTDLLKAASQFEGIGAYFGK